MSFRIMVVYPPRVSSVPEQSRQLYKALDGLAACGEPLSGWQLWSGGQGEAITSERECEQALLTNPIHWRTGTRAHTAYRTRLMAGSAGAPTAFELTSGIEPMGVDEIFTPNRAELIIPEAAADWETDSFFMMFQALIGAFEPLFGFVGSSRRPAVPTAIISDGRPAVGWLTFLANSYPLPTTWPRPAVSYAADGGTIIAAHPEVFADNQPKHLAALERLQTHLEQHDVLLPHHAACLKTPAPTAPHQPSREPAPKPRRRGKTGSQSQPVAATGPTDSDPSQSTRAESAANDFRYQALYGEKLDDSEPEPAPTRSASSPAPARDFPSALIPEGPAPEPPHEGQVATASLVSKTGRKALRSAVSALAWPVDKYARFCAALEARPQARGDTCVEFGVSDDPWILEFINNGWQERISASEELAAEFNQLLRRLREEHDD